MANMNMQLDLFSAPTNTHTIPIASDCPVELVQDQPDHDKLTPIGAMIKSSLEKEIDKVGRDIARLSTMIDVVEGKLEPLTDDDLRFVAGKRNATGLTFREWSRIASADDKPLEDTPNARAMWAADFDPIEVYHVNRGDLPGPLSTPFPHHVISPPYPPDTIGAILVQPAEPVASTSTVPTPTVAPPRISRRSSKRSGPTTTAPAHTENDPPIVAMRRITDRQRELLGQLVVLDDRAVFSSDDHIDDWDALKAVMALLGARWKSGGKGKKGGFVFPEETDPNETIWLARERGEVFDPKKAGFFSTADTYADQLVAKVSPLQTRSAPDIVEPSAGTGNICRAILRAMPHARISCVELLQGHRDILSAAGHSVIGTNFLSLRPTLRARFDGAIMNPPFGGGGDAKHVLHAVKFVKPAGMLSAIVSPGMLFRQTAPYVALKRWVERHAEGGVGGMEEIPAGAFADVGTNIRTLMIWGVVCNQCASGACVTP